MSDCGRTSRDPLSHLNRSRSETDDSTNLAVSEGKVRDGVAFESLERSKSNSSNGFREVNRAAGKATGPDPGVSSMRLTAEAGRADRHSVEVMNRR